MPSIVQIFIMQIFIVLYLASRLLMALSLAPGLWCWGGVDKPASRTGFAAYRAVVDTERMRINPDTAWLLEAGINIWIGEDRHVMTYCIAGGMSFNMVLSHGDHNDPRAWGPHRAVEYMSHCHDQENDQMAAPKRPVPSYLNIAERKTGSAG
ncbi:unnamed protein product [Clonostachys rosea]|uniref:Uncharacterized protein n=1 Tax=Bionectria ochroleuca TaxID=29856 RepID=A0ABY6V1T4_BIOOC|nr:unnamed protein product [Clonostachys rosea]